MEMKGDKKRNGHNCGLYCPCGKMSIGHFLIKLFLALAIIGLILVISIAVIMKVTGGVKYGYKHFGYGMMRSAATSQACLSGGERTGGVVMMGAGNIAFKARGEATAMPERLFGNITKIEKNQITILNNAAQEQTVLSLADTVIISSSTEVGISALKAGQDVIVFGAPNADKVLEAKIIEIQ